MYCAGLPYTGSPLTAILGLAAALLIFGLVLILATRRRTNRTAVALVLLLLGGAMTAGLAGNAAAYATQSSCVPRHAASPGTTTRPPTGNPAHNHLTITQTSTMTGLAPGIAPVPITGTVTNHATDTTIITAITVTITSVTTAPNSATGTCGAGDYTLRHPRMPVGRLLPPGASTPFSGASIGFNNKSTNQNTCKKARINLRYDSS